MKYLLLLLLAPVALACVVPEDGMKVNSSVDFCSDVYYLNHGITISGNDISVNCDGAVLKSWNGGRGVLIENSANVTVSDCRIVNYRIGFFVRNSTKVFLDDNHLVRNKVGTRFVGVSDSATFNQDVSLSAPFEITGSRNNIISLSNRVVSGGFCNSNFCNEQRNSVSLFVQPEATVPQMHTWLFDEFLGRKSAERLFDWVFNRVEVFPR